MKLIQVDQIMQSDPDMARLPHDAQYEKGSAFVHGKYCTREEAAVPLGDMGFLQSDVTYEVAVVIKGRFFRLQDHFDRFDRSCEAFQLRNPYSREEMVEIFTRLIGVTGLRNACVFWCVTRGMPKAWANPVRDRNNPAAFDNRFYSFVFPYGSIATAEQRNRGLSLLISKKHIRIHPDAVDPRAKNFHWMDMKLSLFEAYEQGKDWSVLTDADGYLTEAAGANIFVIKRGELYTPDSGCLEGITRKSVLELAEMAGIRTHVEKVHADQLKEADEAMLTTSVGGVVPVKSVDGIELGNGGGGGDIAIRLHNLYWENVWSGWRCTPIGHASLGSSK